VGVPDGDRVEIDASLNDDISAALERIESRIKSVEDEIGELGKAGAKAGAEFSGGMDKAAESADDVGKQSRQAKKPVKDLGDEAYKTGGKAATGATGLDRFAKKADNAGKRAKLLRTTITAFKFAGVITAVFALAGGLSAIGAGAVIAIGGLGPLSGVLAGALPLYAAAKLSMVAWKLAATQLEPVLTRIKNQFTELGPTIAKGGLQKGLDYFANSIDKLAAASGRGLAGLGAEIGGAARHAGNMARQGPFLAQVNRIFDGLRPIVHDVAHGLLFMFRALMNVLEAALPMAQDAADLFRSAALRMKRWTAENLANGKMTTWLTGAWNQFKRTVGVLWDFLVGLFNIFKIGAGYSRELGFSIENTARRFREWTESAEGQARINKYFQDSLPALREMGKLLGMMLRGMGSLGANANVAPLLHQIRTEFAPAFSELVGNLSGQGGLGPALISAATAMIKFMAALDFSALTMFLQALASVINAVIWIMQNVPGASVVVSSLLGAFLGFKLLGPVWTLVGKGAKAWKWLAQAHAMTGKLTTAQKYMGGIVLPMLRTLAGFIGGVLLKAIKGIGIALRFAFLTTPIGWIITAIGLLVAGFIYLWNHSAAFRDFFIGIWTAIRTAFMAVVNAIVTAWTATVNALKTAWQAVVNFIIMVARWIWDHGLKQVVGIIVTAFKIHFAVIAFIVKTVVYVIIAIVTMLAIIFEGLWKMVAFVATWAFNSVILPVVRFFQAIWTAIVQAAQVSWEFFVSRISAVWNAFYNAVLAPVINTIRTIWTALVNGLSIAWQGFVSRISSLWNGFKSVVSTVVGAIKTVWGALTSWLSSVFTPVGNAIKGVFNGIKNVAVTVGGVIKGVWDAIMKPIKAVWNFLAGAWNAIPTITVPDWVPGLGGSTFGLPKLPLLYAGGEVPGGGPAVVGERGPEPVVVNGQLTGIVGANGPEVAQIPQGGYVVPNLSTLSALPGLTKTLPTSVANAVARSVPGYADALGSPAPAGDSGLSSAIDRLTRSIDGQMPPVHVHGSGDITADVLEAWQRFQREEHARGRYRYSTAGS
jgi:hypothetical protein